MILTLMVIVPLLVAAFAALLLRNRGLVVKYIAFAASLASLAIAIILFTSPLQVQTFQWFSLSSLSFNITTTTASINMLLLMIVSVMTPLIFLYSMGYMDVPSEQPRFYFEMCIFAAAMMLFAISASLITMFIAWEMLGITSYMLIGFWYKHEHAPQAARKAITTILIGDIAMLIGILLIGASYSSFEFSAILSQPSTPLLVPALVLILIGAFTKSAQFPFHEWLSDAMEGPTPVSAFLHSSTMVKAGVFLIAILLPLYAAAHLLNIILIIGLISAIIGATNAMTEKHIKKILAYSTIEDLGLMFIALGLNALPAALVLFFVQSFYKALLFMDAGSIMRANEDREDIFTIYGSAISKPIFITLVVGVLSIAGIFPLSGFFGKALVGTAASQNLLVYIPLLLVEVATSIYIFRWLFVTMRTSYEKEGSVAINYKAIPKTMIIPAWILVVLVFGASLVYGTFFGSFTSSQLQISVVDAALLTVASVIGFVLAFRIYRQGHRLRLSSTNKKLYTALHNNVITNAFYMAVIRATSHVARAMAYVDFAFDRSTYAISDLVINSGYLVRKIVNGQTNSYVLAFILGVIFLITAFIIKW